MTTGVPLSGDNSHFPLPRTTTSGPSSAPPKLQENPQHIRENTFSFSGLSSLVTSSSSS